MMTYNETTNKYDVIDFTNSLMLSDVMSELPTNCKFLKGKTGCGGTTLALRSDEKYIILMPFISNVRNKELTEEGAFVYNGNYEGVMYNTTKICATYESISSLMNMIVPSEWNLVIDEYHILCNHYFLRQSAFEDIKDNFLKFKSYCFMSATEPTVEIGFLKALRKVEINWITNEPTVPTIKRCMSLLAFFEAFKNEDQLFVFYNSVKGIEKIIKEFNITDYQVFMSDHNQNKTLKRGDIQNPSWKKFNFFTSTCFESVDIYVNNPKVLIMMNEKSTHTLLSKNTFKQICGRFRNVKKLNVTCVTEKGKINVAEPSLEDFTKQKNALKGLQIVADAMGESFSWMDYQQNFKYLRFSEGKVKLCVEAYFAESVTLKVVEEYKTFTFEDVVFKSKKKQKVSTLKERIKNIDNDPNYKYYQIIKDCINVIGLENTLRLKSIKDMKNAIINPELLPSKKMKERLSLSKRFYSLKEIKDKLTDEGIYGPASRIKEFYNVQEARISVKGVRVYGYIIL